MLVLKVTSITQISWSHSRLPGMLLLHATFVTQNSNRYNFGTSNAVMECNFCYTKL